MATNTLGNTGNKKIQIISDMGLLDVSDSSKNPPIPPAEAGAYQQEDPQNNREVTKFQRLNFDENATVPLSDNGSYPAPSDEINKPATATTPPKVGIISDLGILTGTEDKNTPETTGTEEQPEITAFGPKSLISEDMQRKLGIRLKTVNPLDLLPRTDEVPEISEKTPDFFKRHPAAYNVLANTYEYSKLPFELAATLGAGLVGTTATPVAGFGAAAGAYMSAKALERGVDSWLYGRPLPETAGDVAKTLGWDAFFGLIGNPFGLGKSASGIAKAAEQEYLHSKNIYPMPTGFVGSFQKFLRSLFGNETIFNKRDMRNVEALQGLIEEHINSSTENAIRNKSTIGEDIKKAVTDIFNDNEASKQQSARELQARIKNTYNEIMNRLNPLRVEGSSVKLKEAAEEAFKNKGNEWGGVTDAYNKAKALIPEGLTSEAKSFTAEMEKVSGDLTDRANIPEKLQEFLKKYTKEGASEEAGEDITTGLSFQQLDDIRKELSESIWKSSTIGAGTSKGGSNKFIAQYYPKLLRAVERDMEDLAKTADKTNNITNAVEGVTAAFRTAKDKTKAFKDIFEDKDVVKMLKGRPSQVAKTIFKKDVPEAIVAAKQAFGEPAFNRLVKPSITKILMGDIESYTPQSLALRVNAYGKEVIDEVYGRGTHEYLKTTANSARDLLQDNLRGNPGATNLLKSIVEEYDTHSIAQKLVESGNVSNYLQVRRMVNKGLKKQLDASYLENMFYKGQERNLSGKLLSFDAGVFGKNIKESMPILKNIVTKEQRLQINKLLSIAERLELHKKGGYLGGSGIGRLQASQIALATGSALSGNLPVAAAIIFTPMVLSRLLVNKTGTRLLSKAFIIRRNTAAETRLLKSIFMFNYNLTVEEERRKKAQRDADIRIYREALSRTNTK